MKPVTETSNKFDRTSTREELYQVIELLGGRTKSKPATDPDALEMEAFELQPSDRPEELWSEVTHDEELALAAEIEPLADLFMARRGLVN
jgi:hypothetical protein